MYFGSLRTELPGMSRTWKVKYFCNCTRYCNVTIFLNDCSRNKIICYLYVDVSGFGRRLPSQE